MKNSVIGLFVALMALPTWADDSLNSLEWIKPEVLAQAQAETLVLTPEAAMVMEQNLFASGHVFPVPAAAFSSDGENPDLFFSFIDSMMFGENSTCVKARVFLRHGIDVASVFATVRDNSVEESIILTLYRVHNATGAVTDPMAVLTTSGQSPNLQVILDNSVSFATVDNFNYSYYLAGCISDTTLGIGSVRIYYDTFIFADGFESGNTSSWSAVAP